MKKLIAIAGICLISTSVLARETNTGTILNVSHGKPYHAFDSKSVHMFYIKNNDIFTHSYNWNVKQCPMFDGKPRVCPENDGGKIVLKPGEEFEFSRKLTMELKCGGTGSYVPTYARSYMTCDDGNYWVSEDTKHASCG